MSILINIMLYVGYIVMLRYYYIIAREGRLTHDRETQSL